MKKIFAVCFVFLSCSLIFSQNIRKPDYIRNDKKILMEATVEFDKLDFGSSLKYVEEAKEQRRKQIDWEYQTLQTSFKSFDVKKAGDSLDNIIPVLIERQDYDSLEIIKRYLSSSANEVILNSKTNLLGYLKKIRPFPEADKLAGDIYKLEGEYDLALRYYTEALKNSDILDIPDEKYDILYEMADISYTLKDEERYEKDLLLIVAQDKAYKDESLVKAMTNTIESTKIDCVEKFFKLYRSNNYNVLTAYSNLAEYYENKNEMKKALTCGALCALTGFSKIFNVVSKRNPDFVYTNVESLILEANHYSDIVEWGIDNNVWKGFNVFAELAYKSTNPIFAVQLYSILKDCSPEDYWREKAEIRLKEITLKD